MTRIKLIRNIDKILNVKNEESNSLFFSSLKYLFFYRIKKRNSRFIEAFVAEVFYDISETLCI